jgi:hypothetical protein
MKKNLFQKFISRTFIATFSACLDEEGIPRPVILITSRLLSLGGKTQIRLIKTCTARQQMEVDEDGQKICFFSSSFFSISTKGYVFTLIGLREGMGRKAHSEKVEKY